MDKQQDIRPTRGRGIIAGLLYGEIGCLGLVSVNQVLFSLAGGLGPDSKGSLRAGLITAVMLTPLLAVAALIFHRAAREVLDPTAEPWGRRAILATAAFNVLAGFLLLAAGASSDLRGLAVSLVPTGLLFAAAALLLVFRPSRVLKKGIG